MKRLFDEDERWTDESRAFAAEAGKALRPLYERYVAEGYGIRDIESVLISEVSMQALQLLAEKRKAVIDAAKAMELEQTAPRNILLYGDG